MSKALRFLLIILLIGLATWRIAPHLSDFTKLISLKNQINPLWILLALVSQTGQYVGDGWLSQIILKVAGYKISLKDTFRIGSLNVFAAHILPVGEVGVIATMFYFYKKLGVQNYDFIFLSICWGFVANTVLAILFLISVIYLPQAPNLPFHPAIIIYILIAVAVFIFFISHLTHHKIWARLTKILSKFSFLKELMTFKERTGYVSAIKNNKISIIYAFIAAAIYYLSNIATLAFSFIAFGHIPNLYVITFAYTLSLVAGWVTLAPAGLGATEATLVLVFLEYGFEPNITIAAVLVFRLISFWLPIPTGFIAYTSLKKQTNEITGK